jgi:hypothetical protein
MAPQRGAAREISFGSRELSLKLIDTDDKGTR